MVLLDESTVVFKLAVGEQEVVVTLRQPSPTELDAFKKSRYKVRSGGGDMQDNTMGARADFFDLLVEDVGGFQKMVAGQAVTVDRNLELTADQKARLTEKMRFPVKSWKDLVPRQWKHAVAQKFEEGSVEVEAAAVPLPS